MTKIEGRFSRWSRLKSTGKNEKIKDVSQQEKYAEAVKEDLDEEAKHNHLNDSNKPRVSSSNVLESKGVRRSIPVMEPLAGTEEGDTEFEAPPPDAIRLLQENQSDSANDEKNMSGVLIEDAQILTEDEREIVAKLPSIEALTGDSDFTPFMAEKVPDFIRRRALSILWRNNPAFAHLDGLNDYDEDFNIIDKLITAATDSNYSVGKGMVADSEQGDVEKNYEENSLQKESGSLQVEKNKINEVDGESGESQEEKLVEGQEDKLSINEKGNETIDGPAGSEKVSASVTDFAQETGLVSIRNVRKPDS